MTALLKYDAACRALAEAKAADEVKDIHDKAEAMRIYGRQAKNVDLEIMASEIRVRAERRLGELIMAAKETGQISRGQPKKNCSDEEQYPRVKLEEIGIDRKLSSRAQKVGGIGQQAFEVMVARMRRQIEERGSRGAIGLMNTEEKAERRANRERILGECQQALPTEKFGVILADPEWRFEPWSRATGMDRAADNHYPTSVTEVIAARDVASIAADDCVLFLWATGPMIREALAVMDAWGFEYKSQTIWRKASPITGYWFRSVHELLLLGTRGNVPAPAMGTQALSVIDAANSRRHSEKPECFLEMIEHYFPTLPKIELNRRGPPRPGWSAWGNEAQPEMPAAGLTSVPSATVGVDAGPPASGPQPAPTLRIDDLPDRVPDFLRRRVAAEAVE